MTPASRPGTPAPLTTAESDILAALTLSSKPIVTPVNPVFGHSSLTQHTVTEALDADAMDWTPTDSNPGTQSPIKADDMGSWLRPQRFFAPEKPTGLEGLFERTLLVDDAPKEVSSQVHARAGPQTYGYMWYLLFLIPILAVGYKIWDTWRRGPQFDTSFNVDSL